MPPSVGPRHPTHGGSAAPAVIAPNAERALRRVTAMFALRWCPVPAAAGRLAHRSSRAWLTRPTEAQMRKLFLSLAVLSLAALGWPATVLATAAVQPAAAATGPCGTLSTPPTYSHVIWIWMENHSSSDIIGNTTQAPYI